MKRKRRRRNREEGKEGKIHKTNKPSMCVVRRCLSEANWKLLKKRIGPKAERPLSKLKAKKKATPSYSRYKMDL